MVKLTSSKGIEADISLDFDKVCEYEASHPDWSIIAEIRKFSKTMRFTSLDLLASFTTHDGGWKGWLKDGFGTEDLMTVISEGLEALGFTSEASQSAE